MKFCAVQHEIANFRSTLFWNTSSEMSENYCRASSGGDAFLRNIHLKSCTVQPYNSNFWMSLTLKCCFRIFWNFFMEHLRELYEQPAVESCSENWQFSTFSSAVVRSRQQLPEHPVYTEQAESEFLLAWPQLASWRGRLSHIGENRRSGRLWHAVCVCATQCVFVLGRREFTEEGNWQIRLPLFETAVQTAWATVPWRWQLWRGVGVVFVVVIVLSAFKSLVILTLWQASRALPEPKPPGLCLHLWPVCSSVIFVQHGYISNKKG